MNVKHDISGNALSGLTKSWAMITNNPLRWLKVQALSLTIISLFVCLLCFLLIKLYNDVVFPASVLQMQGVEFRTAIEVVSSLPPYIYIIGVTACVMLFLLAQDYWKFSLTSFLESRNNHPHKWKKPLSLWINDIVLLLLVISIFAGSAWLNNYVRSLGTSFGVIGSIAIAVIAVLLVFYALSIHSLSQQLILVKNSGAFLSIWTALTRVGNQGKWSLLTFVTIICAVVLTIVLSYPTIVMVSSNLVMVEDSFTHDGANIPLRFSIFTYFTIFANTIILYILYSWRFIACNWCIVHQLRP